jgi:hypothetical protein
MMEHSSRYTIGIDLGTTNSVLAYLDTAEIASKSRVLEIPQRIAAGEIRNLAQLPSFLYFPTEHDRASGDVGLPWNETPPWIVGVMAREQGTLAPGRQVSSAKSWLCQPGADRRGKILPWQAPPLGPKISPVEASAAYLAHLRDAWNSAQIEGDGARCENQDVVLTIPASFDEEARELTVEAARSAGFQRLTLLEEPLAAFYSWMSRHDDVLEQELRDGDLVLVCDIGGGTSDFTLVSVRASGSGVEFERVAIGEHLLLGGDNLDVALARRVMERLGERKLTVRQLQTLQRKCCAAKEQLLSEPQIERVAIALLGSGRAVTGQLIQAELTLNDVVETLTTGFLPLTSADEAPARATRLGLRELGLPYATDAAITRHLSAFLKQAAISMRLSGAGKHGMVRPDAILFNGGFCAPAMVRERIVEAVANWFPEAGEWRPRVLHNEDVASPVATGAAHYGIVRRGIKQRIRAGSARTFYVGMRSEDQLQGVCVLPAGVDEGTEMSLAGREFAVMANRPVSFDLFSSRTRHDAHGEVVSLREDEVHRHSPLVTLLRYGKKLREVELAVRLRAIFTETGTLEIWCEAIGSPHRWRLQFELRAEQPVEAGQGDDASGELPAESAGASVKSSEAGEQAIRAVFGDDGDAEPLTLVSRLEEIVGANRDAWPLAVVRTFGDTLLDCWAGRRKSPQHEVRWLNLFGFCLRPGFGVVDDDSRMALVRKMYSGGSAFPDDAQCQVEWLVLWRRIAGGLNASQQQEVYRTNVVLLGAGGKKAKRLNRQVERELWRLLSACEHLTAKQRVALGDQLVQKIRKEPADGHWLWSLGRLGARVPLYGPLSCVVAADKASEWLRVVLDVCEVSAASAFAITQIALRTDDAARDIGEKLRRETISKLAAAGQDVSHLERAFALTRPEAAQMFGESLPEGLQLVSSLNCVMSITALTSDWKHAV